MSPLGFVEQTEIELIKEGLNHRFCLVVRVIVDDQNLQSDRVRDIHGDHTFQGLAEESRAVSGADGNVNIHRNGKKRLDRDGCLRSIPYFAETGSY